MVEETRLYFRYPGGQPIAVRLSVPEIEPVITSFYSEYVCATPAAGGASASIELIRKVEGYVLTGPSGVWRCATPGEAVVNYENELAGALLTDAVHLIHVHAAAVLAHGRCLLLIGPSGAGKSTLAFGLHLRGMTALSDDVTLLDPGSGALRPFPRPLRAHIEGLAAIGVAAEEVSGSWLSHPYLWLAPDAEPGLDVIPDIVVLLAGEGEGGLARLSATETLAALLRGRLSQDPTRDFAGLWRIAAQASGYRLHHRRLAEALVAVEDLAKT